MKSLYLWRYWADSFRPTIGQITANKAKICHTLELPWKDNKPDVSCIKYGSYLVKYNGLRNGLHSWLLYDVPNRWGILAHSGSKLEHTTGCILFGTELIQDYHKLTADCKDHILLNSTAASKALFAVVGKEDFMLHVKNIQIHSGSKVEPHRPKVIEPKVSKAHYKAMAVQAYADGKGTKTKKTIGWILIVCGYIVMIKEKALGAAIVEIGKQLTK